MPSNYFNDEQRKRNLDIIKKDIEKILTVSLYQLTAFQLKMDRMIWKLPFLVHF